MKKMVCEICGSQSIRKENGVFVCQECGTEYSLDDAKKLLRDVEDGSSNKNDGNHTNAIKPNIPDESEKYCLLKKLSLWLEYVKMIDGLNIHGLLYSQSIWTNPYFAIVFVSRDKEEYLNRAKYWSKDSIEYKIFIEHYKENPEYSFLSKSYQELDEKYNRMLSSGFKYIVMNSGSLGLIKPSISRSERYFGSDMWLFPHHKSNALPLSLEEWIFKIHEQQTLAITHDLTGGIFISGKDLDFDGPNLKRLKESVEKLFEDSFKTYEESFLMPLSEVAKIKKESLDEILLHEEELNALFALPFEYRTEQAIVSIMKIIIDGKADTWKDAVILYDTETFRKELVATIKDLVATANQLNNTIKLGFSRIENRLGAIESQIDGVSGTLEKINKSIDETNKNLKAIKKYSFITMWNTL